MNCKNVIPCHLFLSAEQALGLSLIYKIAPVLLLWLKMGHLLCSSATLVHWHQHRALLYVTLGCLWKCRFLSLGSDGSPPAHILPKSSISGGWLRSLLLAHGTGDSYSTCTLKTQALEASASHCEVRNNEHSLEGLKASCSPEFPGKPQSQSHSGLSEPPFYSTEGFWTSTSRDHILPSGQRASTCSLIKISIETLGGIWGWGWGVLGNETEFLIILKWWQFSPCGSNC